MVQLTNLRTMAMDPMLRLSNAFEERVRSLHQDNYCVRVVSRLPHIWIARLHHMANGNDIIIKAYPRELKLEQYTNRLLTHKEYFNGEVFADDEAFLNSIFSRP